jgi:hypothetical protein
VDTELPIGHLMRVQKWPYETLDAKAL